ncbi:MAG: membrane protein insertion efficiency factor YidD [Candidatus Marinimicrobia bacterium]|nr:membrane protein insertion efficiency factor YidD [Candidatus Neomarinimicrobiota bacterium]MBT3683643.1 membrane protein insertion efficiency factor YidD [Candidatus Neomarinimicrobiota bacterium]MBT3760422.1 membrane protein insertion efficiency factor YidD [Candidatus Neomarinimicrobiota bacterium]MBT3896500.1 membrane protein insertion efficiency factor YidD [Candidatus Neomarinimicrobiota bacterium]MBT4173586.1 membrane protein insertion efficiency factor YidD [Candidatus Neomarinimicro
MFKYLFIIIIKLYQNSIGLVLPNSCRYTPSCSHYAVEAIKKYGAIKGSYLGGKRILTCHPYSKKNIWDPVK